MVYGYSKHRWLSTTSDERIVQVPDPEHLRVLVEILGIESDTTGLLELVDWIARHRERLLDEYTEKASGKRQMKTVLLFLRTFLDGAWASELDWQMGTSVATEKQVSDTDEKLQPLGWPIKEEVADFLEGNHTWLESLRATIWCVHKQAEKYIKPEEADKTAQIRAKEAEEEHSQESMFGDNDTKDI